MSSKIQIVGKIDTRNGLEYPVLDESDVTGGYKSVADSTERNDIPASRRKEGMLVKEISTSKFYTLIGGITDTYWIQVEFGGGSSLNYVIKNTDYTAAAYDYIIVDSTSAISSTELIITSPPTPSTGDLFYILDMSMLFSTYTVTLARNSSNINSQAEDMILDIDGEEYKFIYTNATYGWRLV